MEHRLLESFVAVAEELHFGRAARRLHISQPPLSLQIRRLEEELAVRLFERTSRQVALTEAGRTLLARARHLLSEAALVRDEVRRVGQGTSGALAVGYTPTATYEVLPRIVPAFRRRFPDVRLELREMRSQDQVSALRDGRIELGFACLPISANGAAVTEHTLAMERLAVVLPARHPLARRKSIPVQALRDEPFVLVDPEVEPGWGHACGRALSDAGVPPNVVQRTDTKIALLGLVAAGMGLSVVSASLRVLGRAGVAFRPLTGLTLRLRFGVVLPTAGLSPRALHFWEMTREALRSEKRDRVGGLRA